MMLENTLQLTIYKRDMECILMKKAASLLLMLVLLSTTIAISYSNTTIIATVFIGSHYLKNTMYRQSV